MIVDFIYCRPEASWAQSELGLSATDMERLNIQVLALLVCCPVVLLIFFLLSLAASCQAFLFTHG